jgi:hypothetical protein
VQSQAAIISIVVTLTLVAVQLTASSYSSRVIDVFKRHSSIWFLLCFYILSISLATLLLFFIIGNDSISSKPVLFSILLASGFFILLLLVLFPFIQETLDFLKPDNVLILLLGLIENPKVIDEIDPFQSIFDIVYGAIRNFDFTTMNVGLIEVQKKYEELISTNESEASKKYFAQKYFDNLQRAAILLMKTGEPENANRIINILEINFLESLRTNEITILSEINVSRKKIGIFAAENRFDQVVNRSIIVSINLGEEIKKIEDHSRLKELDSIFQELITIIVKISLVSLEKHIEYGSIKLGVENVETFCIFASDENIIFQPKLQSHDLTILAELDIKQNIGYIAPQIITAIQNICLRNIKNQQNDAALSAIDNLFLIAIKSRNPNQIRYARSICVRLIRIAVTADDLKNNPVKNKVLETIALITQSFPKEFENFNFPNVIDFESNFDEGLSFSEEDHHFRSIELSMQFDKFQKDRKELSNSLNMK